MTTTDSALTKGEISEALTPITTAASPPMPAYSAEELVAALTRYRQLQRTLDEMMPEAIVLIQGRPHRKAAYWRAIGFAFRLTITPEEERRTLHDHFADGTDNFGYAVLVRATAPNGRSVVGDGCAYAVEKAGKFRCPHPHPTREGKTLHYPPETCPAFDPAYVWRTFPAGATEHDVRALAFTRAQCRAIAGLVGFGDGVAEQETAEDDRPRRLSRRGLRAPTAATSATIDEAVRRRLFQRTREAGLDDAAVRAWFTAKGITDTAHIRRDQYDELLDELLIARPGSRADAGGLDGGSRP